MPLRSVFSSFLTAVIFIGSLGLTGCQKPLNSPAPEISGKHNGGQNNVGETRYREFLISQFQVIDGVGNPLADAKILIGVRENQPFPGNLITTNSEGRVELPTEWTDAQPVTIEKSGYVRATYMAQAPGAMTITLRPSLTESVSTMPQVKGVATSFGTLQKDGLIDVGLIVPAYTRREILNFQFSSMISSRTDTITIAGNSLELPSNLALPNQKENYILIPITLNKPDFRLPVSMAGPYRMVAIHARFPFKKVVDEVQDGKTILDVMNHFDFRGAGFRDVDIRPPSVHQDIPVNEFRMAPAINVVAPRYDSRLVMLSLALVESGGKVFPSDLKTLSPGQQMKLKYPTNVPTPGLVVSLLRKADISGGTTGAQVEEMSTVLTPAGQSTAIEFLELPRAPEVRGSTLVMNPPSTVLGLASRTTYAVFSKVERQRSGQIEVELKRPQWEIFADEWKNDLELPDFPATGPAPAGPSRWEVLFVGGDAQLDAQLNSSDSPPMKMRQIGPAIFESATHVTKSAVDIR